MRLTGWFLCYDFQASDTDVRQWSIQSFSLTASIDTGTPGCVIAWGMPAHASAFTHPPTQ